MSYNYKQAFWAVIFDIPDIGNQNRERLASAAADLQTQQGILIALSAGGRNAQESPEISLVVDISADISSLLSGVTTALTKAGLSENTVQLRPEIRFHSFSDVQLRHILQSVAVPKSAPASPAPAKTGTPTVSRIDGSITHDDFSFSVLDSRKKALSDGSNSLQGEFESLRDVFRQLAVETKSSAAVVLMAREGLITIGMKMWIQFVNTKIGGSLITAIEPLISSIGGIAAFRDIVAILHTPLALLSPNVASNFLVVINEQATPLSLTATSVLTGSSGAVVDSIGGTHQPTTSSPTVYSCGLHISLRTQNPVSDDPGTVPSDFQSGMGLALQRTDTPPADFSIGVYAPNSSNGKTNSVRMSAGGDAQGVQTAATQSNNATDSVSVGITGSMFNATGTRQDANGARNYILGSFASA